MVMWNAQSLFAADPVKHNMKSSYVHKLMRNKDVGIWTETHGTPGGNATWRELTNCVSWWAPWATTSCAGVGISIKKDFLDNFNDVRWQVLIPGRAAVLKLKGKKGSLHILATYFPTGPTHEYDRAILMPNSDRNSPPCSAVLRAAMRRRITQHLQPASTALTVVGGDFNFVADKNDRVSLNTATTSGNRDVSEEKDWLSLLHRSGLKEMYQGSHTHASALARSRFGTPARY